MNGFLSICVHVCRSATTEMLLANDTDITTELLVVNNNFVVDTKKEINYFFPNKTKGATMRKPFNQEEVKKAAEILGGRVSLAKTINISYQTVSDWINGKKTPSAENCLRIENATKGKIKARDILPPSSYDPWNHMNERGA